MEDTNDQRTIVNLLTDQIEFANVVILNKTDLVSAGDLGLLEALIKRLNPEARVIHAHFGKVAPQEILDTGLFDFEKASRAAGWIKELEQEHTPETEEYGISSVVFRSRKPFHPQRFWHWLNEDFPVNIIRSKGMFWIASRPDDALNFSQAGGSSRLEQAGLWWASMPYAERLQYADYHENKEYIEKKWTKDWADRMNELVFIGQDMDKALLLQDLEDCLLSETEIEEYKMGKKFTDPFRISI